MALQLSVWLAAAAAPGAWLLSLMFTYALHAAFWSAAVAVLARGQSLSWTARHTLWRLALLAPLATTLVAVTFAAFREAHAGVLPIGLSAAPPAVRVPMLLSAELGVAGDAPALASVVHVLVLLAAALTGLGLLRYLLAVWRLARALRTRRPVRDARWLARLARLCPRALRRPIALSTSDCTDSPLILGAREICLPAQLLAQISEAELDAVLAHELAHIERADGFWFPVVSFIQAVLWLQPTNHWAAARFRESAELACDERAVALTGDPVSLARVLTRVAGHALRGQRFVPLATMARERGSALARVRRLLEPSAAAPASSGRLYILNIGLALLAVLASGLSFQLVRARSSTPAERETRVQISQPVSLETRVTVSELSVEMNLLLDRERQVLATLEARGLGAAEPAGVSTADVLSLYQELRHLREQQLSLERRLAQHVSETASLARRPQR
jgi:beta-lactamase regulating signal transducer with metallopeptidase domain